MQFAPPALTARWRTGLPSLSTVSGLSPSSSLARTSTVLPAATLATSDILAGLGWAELGCLVERGHGSGTQSAVTITTTLHSPGSGHFNTQLAHRGNWVKLQIWRQMSSTHFLKINKFIVFKMNNTVILDARLYIVNMNSPLLYVCRSNNSKQIHKW